MSHRNKIKVDLIKLVSGERLMRLTYLPSGLVLEKKLDPKQAVVRQKERLLLFRYREHGSLYLLKQVLLLKLPQFSECADYHFQQYIYSRRNRHLLRMGY